MNWKKPLVWAAIVVVGLPVGYLGRAYFQKPVDRVQSALNLFETYCVPFANRRVIEPGTTLVRLERADGLVWVDPESTLLLRYIDSGCSVSDTLRPMYPDERQVYDVSVVSMVMKSFPALTPFDISTGPDWTDAENWPAFLFWESHPSGDERRWGVGYVRFSNNADSETELSVSYLIDDEISENLRELRNGS